MIDQLWFYTRDWSRDEWILAATVAVIAAVAVARAAADMIYIFRNHRSW